MAYKITYASNPSRKPARKPNYLRMQAFTAAFLLLFALCVRTSRPEGAAVLRGVLLPREPVDTQAAVQTLVSSLQNGEPLADAVAAFCQEIFHGD